MVYLPVYHFLFYAQASLHSLADFIVFSENLFEIVPEKIKDVKVLKLL